MNLSTYNFFTGNQLKMIAALLMLVDHIGVMLYPDVPELRVIGRLSFPVFSFLIAVGSTYTKNKCKYFLIIFLLGIVCQTVFYFVDGSNQLGIFITFSFSIVLCYLLEYVKKILFFGKYGIWSKIFSGIIFLSALYFTYRFNQYFYVDYGFYGCVLPLFACAFRRVTDEEKVCFRTLDNNFVHVLLFGVGLYLLSADCGGIQMYSMWALPLLFLYSGKRGKWRMKWFFYIFYPAHFIILALIQHLFYR